MNERDEKIIEGIREGEAKMAQPSCPRCKFTPLEFACNVVQTVAGHTVAIIWCGHCGHVLTTQFLGIQQSRVVSPQLVRPA